MENFNSIRRGAYSRQHLFLFLSCVLLLTVVFMAIPRVSNQGAAYFAKQVYYNHGAGRDPHLGQKPRIADSGSQIKSRRLMAATGASFRDRATGKFDNMQF